jgi:hypothetical protein
MKTAGHVARTRDKRSLGNLRGEGERDKMGVIVRDNTFVGEGSQEKKIIIGFEGSKAVPVRPTVEVMHMISINSNLIFMALEYVRYSKI